MTEAEQFAMCDAAKGNTMLVFATEEIAQRYAAHRAEQGATGVMAMCTDTRTGSGLAVMWRDPVPADKLSERLANCRWLLEEALAGRFPWPVPGEVQARKFNFAAGGFEN